MEQTIVLENLDEPSTTWLEQEAERLGLPIEQVIARLIRRAIENAQLEAHHDLDHLAGTWSDEETQELLDIVTEMDSLLLTRDALADVEAAMTRVEGTAVNVGTALDSTEPILTEMRVITTQDLPNSLTTIEDAIPDAVQAAEAIDTTLVTLNRFEINTSILGFPIQYDLGIDYNPTVPFDVSVQEIGRSLDGLPLTVYD